MILRGIDTVKTAHYQSDMFDSDCCCALLRMILIHINYKTNLAAEA